MGKYKKAYRKELEWLNNTIAILTEIVVRQDVNNYDLGDYLKLVHARDERDRLYSWLTKRDKE